jgi:hypothetical protein
MGLLETRIQSPGRRLHLIESGQFQFNITGVIAANSFNALRNIDVSKIDINRLQVFVYGHGFGGATTIPIMGNMAFVSPDNFIIPEYKIVRNTVSIGYSLSGSGLSSGAPGANPFSMGYYVMYY